MDLRSIIASLSSPQQLDMGDGPILSMIQDAIASNAKRMGMAPAGPSIMAPPRPFTFGPDTPDENPPMFSFGHGPSLPAPGSTPDEKGIDWNSLIRDYGAKSDDYLSQAADLINQSAGMKPPSIYSPKYGGKDLLAGALPALILSLVGPQSGRGENVSQFLQGYIGGKQHQADSLNQQRQQEFAAAHAGLNERARLLEAISNKYGDLLKQAVTGATWDQRMQTSENNTIAKIRSQEMIAGMRQEDAQLNAIMRSIQTAKAGSQRQAWINALRSNPKYRELFAGMKDSDIIAFSQATNAELKDKAEANLATERANDLRNTRPARITKIQEETGLSKRRAEYFARLSEEREKLLPGKIDLGLAKAAETWKHLEDMDSLIAYRMGSLDNSRDRLIMEAYGKAQSSLNTTMQTLSTQNNTRRESVRMLMKARAEMKPSPERDKIDRQIDAINKLITQQNDVWTNLKNEGDKMRQKMEQFTTEGSGYANQQNQTVAAGGKVGTVNQVFGITAQDTWEQSLIDQLIDASKRNGNVTRDQLKQIKDYFYAQIRAHRNQRGK